MRLDGGYRKEGVEEGREKWRRGMGEVSSICSLVPRPHPLTRKIGSGDLSSGFIKVDCFWVRDLLPPITLQKTQSVVGSMLESLGYFSTMTQHFFGM